MPRRSKSISVAPPKKTADVGVRALLGPPPLLEGEDAGAYEALYNRILAAVEPKDALEEICVRDIMDLLWETLRLRRLKAALMTAARHEGLEKVLSPMTSIWSNPELIGGWVRRERDSVDKVNSLLKQAGLNDETITAQTLAAKLETFEKIDRMIMQTEARRNAALREIDRHRDVLAQRLRDASQDVEDAEFVEIESARDAAE